MRHKLILLPMIVPVGTAVSMSASAGNIQKKEGVRPNIVFMIADDCTYRDLGCYGGVNTIHNGPASGKSITPNIDRLAEEGVRFTSFFQAAPMSSPTRHCLMTGQYPVRNGAYPNHAFARPGTKSVTHYLRNEGYRVALEGKRHIAPEEVFDYEYLSGGNADVDTSKIAPFIREASEEGTPFCVFICSHQPHTPWNKGNAGLFDPARLVLPDYYVDTPETRNALTHYYAEINYMDRQVGQVMKMLEDTGVADNTVFFFTSEQGNSLPYAKWTSYDMGLQTGMIVRWPGVVKPGTTSDAMAEYVDVVPTMIDIAGGTQPGSLDGKSFRKVLTEGMKEFKKYSFGLQTSRGTINGPDHYGIRSVRSRRFIYIRNLTPEAEFSCAGTSSRDTVWTSWTGRARTDAGAAELVRNYLRRPAEELYDRLADPNQRRNLAGDPEYARIMKKMSAVLDKWMAEQGDKGAETEMEALEHQAAMLEKK